MAEADLLVVGGGFAGLAAAVALAQIGRRIVVLESHQSVAAGFRGELVHARGARILESFGVQTPRDRSLMSRCAGFAVVARDSGSRALLPYMDGRSGFTLPH